VRGTDDGTSVRLAELVGALSLGIDLGFGQPMEHVLRHCLVALRIAERMGLDDDQRATVDYTALLINVGCHSDAHEQAKWFGDDIALKSRKYGHEPRSFAMIASSMQLLGAGRTPIVGGGHMSSSPSLDLLRPYDSGRAGAMGRFPHFRTV
jgi:hypothetical protein